MYQVGDFVRLAPECSTDAEQRLIFVIVETDRDTVTIVCINPVQITPAERVTFNMVEPFYLQRR